MIEQFKQIAHLARQIARIVEEWTHGKAAGSSPGATPTPNKAVSRQSEPDLKSLLKQGLINYVPEAKD